MADNTRDPEAAPQFSSIGFDIPEWLQNKLAEYDQYLSGLVVDRDPPGLVTNIVLTRAYPGIRVTWDRALKAARYLVYRNTTSSFTTAPVVAVLPHVDNTAHFDVTAHLAASTTVYYWIGAQNSIGVNGPISEAVSTDNSVVPAPGQIDDAINGELLFRIGLDAVEIPDVLALGTGLDDDVVVWASDLTGSSLDTGDLASYRFP